MSRTFDRVVIAVPDLAAAKAEYGHFFGADFVDVEPEGAAARAWLALDNTVLELAEHRDEKPRIKGLVITGGENSTEQQWRNTLGLDIAVSDGQASGDFRVAEANESRRGFVSRVDHVVLRTSDAEACIRLFRDELGLRLALDKTVPQWGGRMLFFRAGKMTLEVIEGDGAGDDDINFWGIAYQCRDIEAASVGLRLRGVEHSSIREGRKPGTRVVTPQTQVLGIPTLIVEPGTAT